VILNGFYRHARRKESLEQGMTKRIRSLETIAIHPGNEQLGPGDPLSADLALSTSFKMTAEAGFSAASQGSNPPPIYTRWGNPTVRFLELQLSGLEGSEDAVCFGSGMAAISALFATTLSAGDHLVASNICYAGAAELMHDGLARAGVEVSFVDTSDVDAVANALTPRTKLVYVETPANPILRLTDIAAVAQLLTGSEAQLAVDSTFATPVATRPLDLGADLVIHSLTKYACGHGDTLGGAVLGSRDRLAPLRSSALVHGGAVLHPFGAWLISRSLQTLPVRMGRHEENAFAVARFLEGHRTVEQVFYPGLQSHPQHEIAKRQMANFSGMIAFRTRETRRVRDRFAADGKLVSYALSLGKTKSLVVLVDTDEVQKQSFRLPPMELAKYRSFAGDGIFRLSVGLEHSSDIIADLDSLLG